MIKRKPKRGHPDDIPKATGRSSVSKKPWRSKAYRDSVRASYCIVCRPTPADEAHHIRECFPRTMGVRVGDEWCVPLCKAHHDALHASSRTFWAEQRIDPKAWCLKHQASSEIYQASRST